MLESQHTNKKHERNTVSSTHPRPESLLVDWTPISYVFSLNNIKRIMLEYFFVLLICVGRKLDLALGPPRQDEHNETERCANNEDDRDWKLKPRHTVALANFGLENTVECTQLLNVQVRYRKRWESQFRLTDRLIFHFLF